jgi:glutathionyl-hydroquinone reductase
MEAADSKLNPTDTTCMSPTLALGYVAAIIQYSEDITKIILKAHRTLIVRNLKGLEDVITVDVVDHFLGTDGWRFNDQVPGATQDRVNNFHFLSELYKQSEPQYDGRFTVPVLYDKQVRNNSVLFGKSEYSISL